MSLEKMRDLGFWEQLSQPLQKYENTLYRLVLLHKINPAQRTLDLPTAPTKCQHSWTEVMISEVFSNLNDTGILRKGKLCKGDLLWKEKMRKFLDLQDSWRKSFLSSTLGQAWVRCCKVTIPFLMILSGVSGCLAGGGKSRTDPGNFTFDFQKGLIFFLYVFIKLQSQACEGVRITGFHFQLKGSKCDF